MRNVRVLYRLSWALFGFIMIGSLLGAFHAPVAGQTVSWEEPTPLSSSGVTSWFPDVIADRSGIVHVTWASGVPDFDAVLYSHSTDGKTWSEANDVAAMPIIEFRSAATRPAMVIDRQGYLHLTYVDTIKMYYAKVPIWDADKASAWTEPQTISGDQTAYFSRMAIDSKGVIHLIFTQNFPTAACLNCYHLYYRQSTDDGDTWSNPVDISADSDGVAKPQILIDKQDNIHVVWESGQGGGLGQLFDPTGVKYISSLDNGKTWTASVVFAVPDNTSLKNITIGLDKHDSLVVAFWALPYDWILYSLSADNGATWTEPLQIPNVWGAAALYKSNLDDYSMASDSAGNLHLVAVGRTGLEARTVDVLDMIWDGENWEGPLVIASYDKDVPEWPRVAISGGNQVNVVWFVRDQAHIWDSAAARYRIWYAKGISAAPAENSEPILTFTPTVAPTETASSATATLAPSATVEAVPTFALDPAIRSTESKPADDILYTEQDYLVLLGKAVLPSLVFLAGAIAIAVIRRR